MNIEEFIHPSMHNFIIIWYCFQEKYSEILILGPFQLIFEYRFHVENFD